MDNINQILKKLEKRGFRLERGNGSRGKLFPPEPEKPFYSIHLSGNERVIFPLNRFAKKKWGIDIKKL